MSKNILLNTVDKVKNFVNITTKFPFDICLKSGRYTIDAKSIMGIFSLNLAKPIKLVVDECVDAEQSDSYFKAVAEFIQE